MTEPEDSPEPRWVAWLYPQWVAATAFILLALLAYAPLFMAQAV